MATDDPLLGMKKVRDNPDGTVQVRLKNGREIPLLPNDPSMKPYLDPMPHDEGAVSAFSDAFQGKSPDLTASQSPNAATLGKGAGEAVDWAKSYVPDALTAGGHLMSMGIAGPVYDYNTNQGFFAPGRLLGPKDAPAAPAVGTPGPGGQRPPADAQAPAATPPGTVPPPGVPKGGAGGAGGGGGDLERMAREGADQKALAATMQENAEINRNDRRAPVERNLAAEQLANVQKQEAINASAQAYAEKAQAHQAAWIQDLHDTKTDPARWWNSRTDDQKFSAKLGLVLSHIGGAIAGQKPVDYITEFIDKDIAAQKQDVENKGKAIDADHNLMASALKQFGDQRMATEAVRVAKLQAAQKQLEAIDASTANPYTRAKIQELQGGLKTAEADSIGKLRDTNAGIGLKRAQAAHLMAEAGALGANGGGKTALQVGGQNFRFGTPEEAQKFQQQIAAAKTLAKSLGGAADQQEAFGLYEKAASLPGVGHLLPSSEKMVRSTGAVDSAAVNANHALGNDMAMQEKAFEMFKHSANNPFNPGATRAVGHQYTEDAVTSIVAKLMTIPGVTEQQARAAVMAELGGTLGAEGLPGVQKGFK